MTTNYHFDYNWTLRDASFPGNKGKVFSTFACGGGSSMGYKLAGFDVIGCNEIDPGLIEIYKNNLNPKFAFPGPIQEFKNRNDFPDELYDLDILDGSPPCSSFTLAGVRSRDWGKKKNFREGQSEQVLDTLFFDFIELANKLQPKVVFAENVTGILLTDAQKYVIQIYKDLEAAGYNCQHFTLNASKMGVPQQRKRVFFIALRNDLADQFLYQATLFEKKPLLELEFTEKPILFSEFEEGLGPELTPSFLKWWELVKPGQYLCVNHPKGSYFNSIRINPHECLKTITATAGAKLIHYKYPNEISEKNIIQGSTFPLDYDFGKQKVKYVCGMSVPPVMVAKIACQIYDQWLSKL